MYVIFGVVDRVSVYVCVCAAVSKTAAMSGVPTAPTVHLDSSGTTAKVQWEPAVISPTTTTTPTTTSSSSTQGGACIKYIVERSERLLQPTAAPPRETENKTAGGEEKWSQWKPHTKVTSTFCIMYQTNPKL